MNDAVVAAHGGAVAYFRHQADRGPCIGDAESVAAEYVLVGSGVQIREAV